MQHFLRIMTDKLYEKKARESIVQKKMTMKFLEDFDIIDEKQGDFDNMN